MKPVIKSKKKGSDHELIQSNQTSNPQNQKEKKHTHKLINVHERHAQITKCTPLSQTGGSSANLIETAVTSILPIFYFKLQNIKRKHNG